MIVAVASGKGGTGKTSVAVNMALSVGNVQLLDCDVEEPNAHLLLHPNTHRTEPVYILVPRINEELCLRCGECAEFCQYNALFASPEKVLFFPELCHSCGGCTLACPRQAITEQERRIGALKFGAAETVELVYGELDAAARRAPGAGRRSADGRHRAGQPGAFESLPRSDAGRVAAGTVPQLQRPDQAGDVGLAVRRAGVPDLARHAPPARSRVIACL